MMEELAKALQEVKEICRTHRCWECTFNTDGGCAFPGVSTGILRHRHHAGRREDKEDLA